MVIKAPTRGAVRHDVQCGVPSPSPSPWPRSFDFAAKTGGRNNLSRWYGDWPSASRVDFLAAPKLATRYAGRVSKEVDETRRTVWAWL